MARIKNPKAITGKAENIAQAVSEYRKAYGLGTEDARQGLIWVGYARTVALVKARKATKAPKGKARKGKRIAKVKRAPKRNAAPAVPAPVSTPS